MSFDSQEYARLSDFSYGRDETGRAVDLQSLVGKARQIGGVEYKVLAYADKPSGYQGTIFQRVDSGEIIVAHRGTEFERELGKDLLVADGKMVVLRTNVQAAEAIELTREALAMAEREGVRRHSKAPEVTVTGHSLGGTLAQISGHYFGLKGETFNAYGAASLNLHHPVTGQAYRIPEGGHDMINHVMAADLVSSASAQYGQVRIYATYGQVDTLRDYGYENSAGWFDARADVPAAVSAMRSGAHDMNNFLPFDGQHRPDVSVLGNPEARRLAQHYAPMIDKFRHDIAIDRGAITLATRSLQGLAEDAGLMLREPWPPGQPARVEPHRTPPKTFPHATDSRLRADDVAALPLFLSPHGVQPTHGGATPPTPDRKASGTHTPSGDPSAPGHRSLPPAHPPSDHRVGAQDVAPAHARDPLHPPGPRTADMRDPTHPAHPRYLEAYAGVVEIDRSRGRTPDAHSENLAASLTAASAHLSRVSHVVLSQDGRRAFAVDTANLHSEARQIAYVDVGTAVARPAESSTRDWQQAIHQHAMQATPALPVPEPTMQRARALG